MKRTISVWACLAFFASSQLVAKDSVATAITNDLAPLHTITAIPTAKPEAEKSLLLLIPNVILNLQADKKLDLLKVDLRGAVKGPLDWVIFQPSNGVTSRITTTSKIDQIKIDGLDSGSYILMIKDSLGRALFKPFEID